MKPLKIPAKTDSTIPIIILLISGIALVMILALLLGFGGGSNGGSGGTSEARAVDVSNPEDKRMTEILSVYSGIKNQENQQKLKQSLADLQVQIDQFGDSIQTSTTFTGDKASVQAQITNIDRIVQDLSNRLSKASGNSVRDTEVNNKLKDLDTALAKLRKAIPLGNSASGSAVADIAKRIAQQNEIDHKIVYSQAVKSPTSMDCSYFMSYVLSTAGVLGKNENFTTGTLISALTNKKYSLFGGNLVAVKYATDPVNGSIPKDEVTNFAEDTSNGIKPGDIILSNSNDGAHVVMYIGPTISSKNNIAHSTTKNGKSGPQLGDLSDRIGPSSSRRTIAVFRPM